MTTQADSPSPSQAQRQRVQDWEELVEPLVEKHRNVAHTWGVSDCFIFPLEYSSVITGIDFRSMYHPTYDSQEESSQEMQERGYGSLKDVFVEHFTEIPPVFAQRGDIAVVKRGEEEFAGVFTGKNVLAKSKSGLAIVPRSWVTAAFMVPVVT